MSPIDPGIEAVIAANCAPDYVAGINEPYRRRLGRMIRRLVDENLRYGDGSGEESARVAFDALADSLDPENDGVQHDMEVLAGQCSRPRATAVSPTLSSRQSYVLQWMREREAHNGLTTSEIVDVIGHPYDALVHARRRCFDDLKVLAEMGLVSRDGSPARWSAR